MVTKADLLKKYIPSPELFVRYELGAEPQPWQLEFLRAVAEEDRVAVRSGHGVGKTTVLAWLILWFLITRYPVKIAVTAPSFNQLDGALWAEIRTWHSKMKVFKNELIVTSDKVELVSSPGENFARARTSSKDNPEALAGLHSENMIFIIDEASGVDQIVFETASGSMSTKGAKQILTGNPTRADGYFYNAFNVVPELWKLFKVSCFDCLETGFVTEKFIEEQKIIWGENSNTYRVRVLGEFPDESEDVLISRSLVEAAVTRDVEVIRNAPVIWGLDVARFGSDRSALCKRKGNAILEKIQTWRNKDNMEIADRVAYEYKNAPTLLKPEQIYVDNIGVGAGVIDRLRQLGLPAIGVNVGEKPTDSERFVRLRDELWWKTKEWFDARDCKIPKDDVLISELVSPRYELTAQQKIKIESKDDMRKRQRKSPDVADALCLTMMNTSTFNPQFKKPIKIETQWIV